MNGDIRFWHENVLLKHGSLSGKPKPPSQSKQYRQVKGDIDPIVRKQIAIKAKQKSPWNQFNPHWIKSEKQTRTIQKSIR